MDQSQENFQQQQTPEQSNPSGLLYYISCFQSKKVKFFLYITAGVFILALLIGGLIIFFEEETLVFQNYTNGPYVYCPSIFAMRSFATRSHNKDFEEYVQKYKSQLEHLYIVAAKSGQEIFWQSSKYQLNKTRLRVRFCGYARRVNQTCQNQGRFVCSIPGPYFDVEENRQIKVLWINDYSKIGQNEIDLVQSWSINGCFGRFPKGQCNKTAKSNRDSQYILFDPILKHPKNPNCYSQKGNNFKFTQVLSSRDAFPLSPHVHGLEAQPFYDGNPLSWFDNNGNIGIGFYHTQADEQEFIKNNFFRKLILDMGFRGKSMKLNIYKNNQGPGSLWYHDHSMGVTGLNVRLGLQSFYIIRNESKEKDLPKGEFQIIIMIHRGMINQGTILSCRLQCTEKSSQNYFCKDCLKNNESQNGKQGFLILNATYRIRILNGDYMSRFSKIKFIFFNCNSSEDPQECSQVVPFSVIGTDSLLRRFPIHDQMSLSLGPAQRVDILITILPKVLKRTRRSKLLIVCNSFRRKQKNFNYIKLSEYRIIDKKIGKFIKVDQIEVPFVDLSKINEFDISIKRMRPFIRSTQESYGINNHLRFNQGLSENPKIGTIQDWYIINTLSEGHPFHMHLVQFQIIEVVSLKSFSIFNGKSKYINCTYYQIDLIKAQVEQNRNEGIQIDPLLLEMSYNMQNISGLCDYIQNKMTDQLVIKLFGSLKNEQSKDLNRVSGFDVLAICSSREECFHYGETLDSRNQYKYINPEIDTSQYLQQYMKGWKDTFWIPQFSYAKLRIRWTSTDFPQEKLNPLDPGRSKIGCDHGYFHIPQQNMTQYPGFLYHCHVLTHEDRGMMRPIMLQPSGCGEIESWEQRWKKRYCR